MTLLATPTIIGIIASVTLVAVTLAVCLYLYSLKNKDSSEESQEPSSEGSSSETPEE